MTHPLVLQLRFTRSEFQRALEGVTDEEARKRFMPMNCISWIVAHLAFQEQLYWSLGAQVAEAVPELEGIAGFRQPATTPPLDEMWQAWNKVMASIDPWLDTLTTEMLTQHMMIEGEPVDESTGSLLRRVTYHYWYHLGESQAIRQMLGQPNLPVFVGDIHGKAPYIPENGTSGA